MEYEIRLDVYSHNVKVSHFSARGKEALFEFCRSLTEFGLKRVKGGRFVRQMMRVFAAATADRTEFRFHRHQLNELIAHLKNYNYHDQQIQIVEHPLFDPVPVTLTNISDRTPYDYQENVIEYLSSGTHTKVITTQTGKGKGLMCLMAMARLGWRTVFVIKGMYVEKWKEEIIETFGLKPEELMIVRGGSNLKTLIDLALAGKLEAKIIICTNKTMYNFMKTFEKFKDQDMGYGCRPEEFYQVLGAGVRVIDEAHQEFHTNFRQDLYSHIPTTISMSATLEPDDPFLRRMYEIVYPRDYRMQGIEYDRYIAVKALMYSAPNIRKLRFKSKQKSYSHVEFEKSLMRNKQLLEKYIEMIAEIVSTSYIRQREDGQKMLIFCSTVDLCTLVAKRLQVLHPTLDVTRYVSEDDYEQLLNADISVSTLKSAGTAVDIKNLRVTLLTDAVGSRQANEQSVGRLRHLKDWPDVTPEFIYLVCTDIPQHIRYHERKQEFLADKVLSQKIFNLGERL